MENDRSKARQGNIGRDAALPSDLSGLGVDLSVAVGFSLLHDDAGQRHQRADQFAPRTGDDLHVFSGAASASPFGSGVTAPHVGVAGTNFGSSRTGSIHAGTALGALLQGSLSASTQAPARVATPSLPVDPIHALGATAYPFSQGIIDPAQPIHLLGRAGALDRFQDTAFHGVHSASDAGSGATGGDPSGQLWYGLEDISNSGLDHIDSDDAGHAVSDVPTTSGNANVDIGSVGLDGANGLYFFYGRDGLLRDGHIENDIETGGASELSSVNMVYGTGFNADIVNALAVDPLNHIVFIGHWGQTDALTGIFEVQYNPTTGALTSPFNATSDTITDSSHVLFHDDNSGKVNGTTSFTDVTAMQYDMQNSNLYYVDESGTWAGSTTSGSAWAEANGIYVVSTTTANPTPTLLTLTSQFAGETNNAAYIIGLAINEAQGLIYFAVNDAATLATKFYYMPIAGGVNATQMTAPVGFGFVDADEFGGVNPLAFDANLRQLYVSDQTNHSIAQFTLSTDGHSFTSGTDTFQSTNPGSDGGIATSLLYDPLPTLNGGGHTLSGTSSEALQGGSALALLTAAPAITDPQDGTTNKLHMGFAKIQVVNAQTGDALFVNGQNSGSLLGVSVNWNSSTHTLTLTGDATEATYETLLAEVSFQDTGTDNSTGSHPTRTLDWTISDGITVANPTTSDPNDARTTLVIDRAPTLGADNYAILEGGTSTGTSGTGGTGVLGNDSDKDGDAIAITAVNGSGANVGSGTFQGSYGHLNLASNGGFTYTANLNSNIDNAATGSHPVDTFTYTVSDGVGGVTTTTVSFTINRAPTTVGDTGAAVESASGSGNVLTNDSDKDGDSLTVTLIGAGAVAPGAGGSTFAGTYGHLTMHQDGTYTYAADNTAAIDGAGTGSHLTDSFTYTANDGHGGTTTANLVVTLDRAPTVVADTGAAVEASSGSGNVLTNDSDRDGDSLSVSLVDGSIVAPGGGGSTFVGTYGHLTMHQDGSYTYNADNTSAIDGAATGSHLTDTFTYTASDGFGGGVTTTTVVITLDRAPTVVNGGSAVVEGGTATVNAASGILAADSDRDGNSLAVSQLNGNAFSGTISNFAGTYGHLSMGSDGSYSYVADNTAAIDAAPTGSHPVDTLTCTVSDGHGVLSAQTLSFTIDRAPTLVAEGSSVAESGTASGTAGTGGSGALAGDSDRDGDALSVVQLGGNALSDSSVAGTYGHLTLGSDGSYSYVADNTAAIDAAPTGSHPVDTFNVTVGDNHGGTSSTTLTFTIDRPGIANADAITTTESSTVTASTEATGLLGNDVDPDTNNNAGLSVIAVNGSAGNVGNQINFADGSFITVNADGTYTYNPNHAWDFLPAAASGAPSTGTETFSYTITGGSTVTATITINGQDSNDTLQGTAGNDTYNGGVGDDIFKMQDGGNDNVSGGAGDDTFYFDGTLTAADTINGGTQNDTLVLGGNYTGANALVLGATTLTSVEHIALHAGFSYDITTNDANVGAGQTLLIRAGSLGAGDSLTFDGSAETDGSFAFAAGAGNDSLTGGAGADRFDLFTGGNDTAHGGAGNDIFVLGGAFTAADSIDGGSGDDLLLLNGDYTGGNALIMGAATMTDIAHLRLAGGHSYDLTTNDANLASGQHLAVNGAALGPGDSLTFDGSAETDGRFTIVGGDGNDSLTGGDGNDVFAAGNGANTIQGGGGADNLTGGSGADTFVYNGASDSTSIHFDAINGFDASSDFFHIVGDTVAAIDTAVTSGVLGPSDFDGRLARDIGSAQLAAHDAVLFTPSAGNYAGHTFLVVDLNGTAGYQAGQDLVIELSGAQNMGSFGIANFT